MSKIATRVSLEREEKQAERLGQIYHEIQSQEWACSELVCTFPHDGNCWCFNTALARWLSEQSA